MAHQTKRAPRSKAAKRSAPAPERTPFTVYFRTPEEIELLKDAAKVNERTVSYFVREVALREARQVLTAAGQTPRSGEGNAA